MDNLKHHRLPPPLSDLTKFSRAELELWVLTQQCWNIEPSERPTAQYLLNRIQEIITGGESCYIASSPIYLSSDHFETDTP